MRIVSSLFPDIIISFAYKQFTSPQLGKLRKNELSILKIADKEKYRFKDFDIQLYTWKGGNKKIFLIHGWGGQAGNYSEIIEELLINNYTIYSFDFPSHGYSSIGKTNLIDIAELIVFLIKKNKIKSLISHSLGSLATTYALFNNREIEIDKYILLTTPDKFTQQIDYVLQITGVNNKLKKRLIDRFEKDTKTNVKMLNVSDFAKAINVRESLIMHDKKDKVIPICRSKSVHKNWNISKFIEVEGTGHFRILRTKKVIDEIINFLNSKK